MVDQGARIRSKFLFYALESYSLKILKYFISFGANINFLDRYKNNILFKVFNKITNNTEKSKIKKLIKIVKYILINGIDLLHQNDKGMDALLYSLKLGEIQLTKMIIPLLKYPKI